MRESADVQNIRLIVGLGNPGNEYEHTRHNIGFMCVDEFLAEMPANRFEMEHRYDSFFWKGNYSGKVLVMQKPQTYMNLSGNAVVSLQNAEKVLPEQILVVHDDMDLPLGKIRIRKGGSSGGHNGIKSIIEQLGTQSFPRIRLGIGHSACKKDTADYVLSSFSCEENVLCRKEIHLAVEAVFTIVRRGIQAAMNQYNAVDLNEDCGEIKINND